MKYIEKDDEGNIIKESDEWFGADKLYVKCDICGKYEEWEYAIDCDGKIYCDDCRDEYLSYCDHCSEWYLEGNTRMVHTRYGNEFWCDDCLNDDAFYCNECEEYYDSGYYDSITCHDETICSSCAGYSYRQCDNCGEWNHEDDGHYIEETDEWLCDDCYDDLPSTRIRGYHERPPMVYYSEDGSTTDGKGFKGYGIELEIDHENFNHEDEAIELLDYNMSSHTYYNRDGSLNNGFEIITLPHTRKALLDLRWEETLQGLVKMGYRSHDAGTCGLHLHASRLCFGETEEERTVNIAKVIYFWEDILKFSRRTANQADRWAKRYSGASYGWADSNTIDNVDTIDKATKVVTTSNYGRYFAVNLENCNTIEFRLMRGTLNYDTFRATLDFLMKIVENAPKVQNIENKDEWLDGIEENTINYMKKRKCFGYSNDSEEEEEECV